MSKLGKDHLDEFQSFIDYDKTSKSRRDDLNEYVRQ
jgi:hypothetical protein